MEQPPSGNGLTPATYHRGRNRVSGAVAGAAVAVAIVAAFLRWKPFRVEVEGASMVPTLLPGDWALAVGTRRLRRGDVVVVEHPGRPGYEMVKRLTGVPRDRLGSDGRVLGDDEWWVEGDHEPGSTDSRHFGPVSREELKAKVLLVYWPSERRRLL
ncbi:MAG TPA: S26 family signal peptidase [Actinomycetota bacterium]|nr:S26 family signal peptidase [Actinomycetota bacterium]